MGAQVVYKKGVFILFFAFFVFDLCVIPFLKAVPALGRQLGKMLCLYQLGTQGTS